MSTDNLSLSGIRVLDLTQIYNGPYATFLMAMAGAEVIKIEPPAGEQLRKRDGRGGAGYPFMMLNPNKRSMALDLKNPAEIEIFLELAETADVVVENFSPGVVDRLGVGFNQVKARKPDIIYASGSGYGQSGPYRDFQAMDLAVQAMSGIMAVTGYPDQPPVKAGVALCDFFGGVHLYGGVVTALLRRERTGQGGYVDVSMQDSVFPSLASNLGLLFGQAEEQDFKRVGNLHGGLSICPYGTYPARDGNIALMCNHNTHWHRLLTAMGRDDLIDDPRYAEMPDRVAHIEEITDLISAWSKQYERAELMTMLTEARIPIGAVRELSEVVRDEHLHARGMLHWAEAGDFGRVLACASPLNIDGENRPEYRAPVALDSDREDILAELAARRNKT